MTYLLFAALYAVLLAVSFGRGASYMRSSRSAMSTLRGMQDEWLRRTLDVTVVGTGEITLGTKLGVATARTFALTLRTTDGVDIAVPAGLQLDIGARAIRAVRRTFVVRAGTELTAYLSTYIPDEGVLRTASQLPPDTRVILVARGESPFAATMRALHRTWRPGRVALVLAIAGGLVAASTVAMWLAVLGAVVLAVDAALLRSAIVVLNCTRQG